MAQRVILETSMSLDVVASMVIGVIMVSFFAFSILEETRMDDTPLTSREQAEVDWLIARRTRELESLAAQIRKDNAQTRLYETIERFLTALKSGFGNNK